MKAFLIAVLACVGVSEARAYAPSQDTPKAHQLPSAARESFLPRPDKPFLLVTVPLPRKRPSQDQQVEKPSTAMVGLPLNLLALAEKNVGATARQLGMHNPSLWCAEAINAWLRKLRARGTNSNLAVSFAHWGKASAQPCIGCIGVKYRRGGSGHVVIVKAIRGNKIIAISPNGGHGRVQVSTYPIRAFYTFRQPPA